MVPSLTLIHKYASTFREAINAKVRNSEDAIRNSLKLNSSADWDFLCAAMDIIDDASAAIDHVQQYGLSGATKYNNVGEKYLRLYGLLSATYIQQQSALTIFRIMNVPDPKKAKEKFDSLEIRALRHKLSAHSTDYLNKDTGEKEAFVPIRFDLGDTQISYANHTASMQNKKINLTAAIEAHSRLMIDVLDTILDKTIKTIFKGHEKKQQEFNEKLSDLRTERDGGLVFGGVGPMPKIIVTFVGSKTK
jgi:hypothetical protein